MGERGASPRWSLWTTVIVRGDAVAQLESVGCELPLGEVYAGA